MDDIVLRGMAKWPNVPAVYGWLALDRRGNWLLQGERIANPAVTAFIARNYLADESGCWFFQNGPQRVFVALEYTPLIYRVIVDEGTVITLESHLGKRAAKFQAAWMDEDGSLLLLTELGVGLVHDSDLPALLPGLLDINGNPLQDTVIEQIMDAFQQGIEAPLWLKVRDTTAKVGAIRSDAVPARFGFIPAPGPDAATPARAP